MATFGNMIERIEDEIRDATINSNVRAAILTAITDHEFERWWWNEDNSLRLTLSSSQEFYTSSHLTAIPNLLHIDDIRVSISGSKTPLRRRSWEWFERVSTGAPGNVGIPSDFTYYQQQLRFYPVPNATITADISSVVRLATLSATADTNAWTNDAEAMIRCQAKAHLYAHVKGDDVQAQKYYQMAQLHRSQLVRENVKRLSRGRTEPWQF